MKLTQVIIPSTLAFLMTAAMSSIAQAGTIRDDRSDRLYRDLAKDFPSVGMLDIDRGTTCSGTLIASEWVLTAGHCVYDKQSDNSYGYINSATFTVGGLDYAGKAVATHPGWIDSQANLSSDYDIALIKLDSSVTDIKPATLYTGNDEIGEIGTFVGFGRTGDGLTGQQEGTSGIKRAGTNIIDWTGVDLNRSSRILLADFDNPLFDPATSLEYSIAKGDSGGGMFINGYLAGVNSFAAGLTDGKTDSSYTDLMGVTRVSSFVSWINNMINNNTQVSDSSGFDADSTTNNVESDLNANTYALSDTKTKVPESSTPVYILVIGAILGFTWRKKNTI
jgi:hypothetical protein